MGKGTDSFVPSVFYKNHTKAFSHLKLLSDFSHLAQVFFMDSKTVRKSVLEKPELKT